MFTYEQIAAMQQHRYGKRDEEGLKRVPEPGSRQERLTETGSRLSQPLKGWLVRLARSA